MKHSTIALFTSKLEDEAESDDYEDNKDEDEDEDAPPTLIMILISVMNVIQEMLMQMLQISQICPFIVIMKLIHFYFFAVVRMMFALWIYEHEAYIDEGGMCGIQMDITSI
ncbi:MAG: hypothetical protein EZS28_016068 [Streblomastix strix]|uniref:Uncharacterized protein n=1 Tax=Streblomastix strix TaxID=222440 RepID=A0A5J4W0K0_9EUKA|nr:MAG: hypothetical protein EZS28_016068 [Streblomastix strix]